MCTFVKSIIHEFAEEEELDRELGDGGPSTRILHSSPNGLRSECAVQTWSTQREHCIFQHPHQSTSCSSSLSSSFLSADIIADFQSLLPYSLISSPPSALSDDSGDKFLDEEEELDDEDLDDDEDESESESGEAGFC